jgi:hypothetical protein
MTYLKSWSRGAAAGTIALLLMAGAPVQAADNPQIAAEIMALARAQWASEIAGAPMAQQNVSLADDYTEFNGDFPTLLVGKTMSTRMGEVTPYDKAMYSDIAERARAGLRRYRRPDLQFRRPAARRGQQSQPLACEIDPGLCQRGRTVEAGPRQLRTGGGRPLKLEEGRSPNDAAALVSFPSRTDLLAIPTSPTRNPPAT